MPEDSSRACGCGSILAHAALALTIAGAVLFCSQALAQLNAMQQLFEILLIGKGSWAVAYTAAVIATTVAGPVLALLSSLLMRILPVCKADAISKNAGAVNVPRRKAQYVLARVLCVMLFLFTLWTVLLAALEATGLVYMLDTRTRATAVMPGGIDSAESQHCFDFALFQRRSHTCDPKSIQKIADTLDAGIVFACLSAGGLLLMWLGCQIFMWQSCEAAAVTSLLVRRALHHFEQQSDVLNSMEMQVFGRTAKICPGQDAAALPPASAPAWPPRH